MKPGNQGEAYSGSCSTKNFFADLTFYYSTVMIGKSKALKMVFKVTSGDWGLSILGSSLVGLFCFMFEEAPPPSPPVRSTYNGHHCLF